MDSQFFLFLLDLLDVPHSDVRARKDFESQPSIWTIFGLAVLLTRYHIANKAIEFTDRTDVTGAACPFVAILGGEYVIVLSIGQDYVSLVRSDGRQLEMSKPHFLSNWNGVALLVSSDEDSRQPGFSDLKRNELNSTIKRIGAIASMLIISGIAVYMSPFSSDWSWWTVLAVNLFGLCVGYMLLLKQLHIDNAVVSKICGLIKESHCDNVTQSDASTLFGLVKLSEVGFAYFSLNVVCLLLFPALAFPLALVSVCVLPFTLWSLWYQKFKARSWCMLCLLTLCAMWLQAGVYVSAGAFSFPPSNWIVLTTALLSAYALSTLAVNRVMSLVDRGQSARRWELSFANLKAHDQVFDAFEGGVPVIGTSADECTGIVFGNPDAARRLTIFSNPYCGPCAEMHKRLEGIIGEDVSVGYAMTFFSEDLSMVNRYIIAAYQQLGAEKAWDILTLWFEGGKKQGEAFFKNYRLDMSNPDIEAEFSKHMRWSERQAFPGTPTVLINGREAVGPYTVDDYPYFPL